MFWFMGVGLLGGCGLSPQAAQNEASAQNGLTTVNALTTNALTTNALTTNALTTNALMSASSGTDAAMIIKYSARCMLTPSQSVTVSYKNASGVTVSETYFGLLGLQPQWISGGLSSADKAWWSACLAAHTNAYGTAVGISARAPAPSPLTTTVAEKNAYWIREGAFWAENDPNTGWQYYSCYDPNNLDQTYLNKRVCSSAVPGEPASCGARFHSMGWCSAYCDEDPVTGLYTGCTHDENWISWSNRLITTYTQETSCNEDCVTFSVKVTATDATRGAKVVSTEISSPKAFSCAALTGTGRNCSAGVLWDWDGPPATGGDGLTTFSAQNIYGSIDWILDGVVASHASTFSITTARMHTWPPPRLNVKFY